jgi:predicted nucleotidyltransferase
LELAAINGKLRRAFVWGSFVTAKPAPKDVDILLVMDEDFEVDSISAPAQAVFDSVHAKLLFESDVFWGSIFHRARIARSLAGNLSDFEKLSETRYCGIGARVIQTDEQMLLAQECVANLRRILLEARKVHSRRDYARMAEPILLEVQQREQEILEYLSRDLGQPVAS